MLGCGHGHQAMIYVSSTKCCLIIFALALLWVNGILPTYEEFGVAKFCLGSASSLCLLCLSAMICYTFLSEIDFLVDFPSLSEFLFFILTVCALNSGCLHPWKCSICKYFTYSWDMDWGNLLTRKPIPEVK